MSGEATGTGNRAPSRRILAARARGGARDRLYATRSIVGGQHRCRRGLRRDPDRPPNAARPALRRAGPGDRARRGGRAAHRGDRTSRDARRVRPPDARKRRPGRRRHRDGRRLLRLPGRRSRPDRRADPRAIRDGRAADVVGRSAVRVVPRHRQHDVPALRRTVGRHRDAPDRGEPGRRGPVVPVGVDESVAGRRRRIRRDRAEGAEVRRRRDHDERSRRVPVQPAGEEDRRRRAEGTGGRADRRPRRQRMGELRPPAARRGGRRSSSPIRSRVRRAAEPELAVVLRRDRRAAVGDRHREARRRRGRDVELGRARATGSVETPRARLELLDPGRNWVRVTRRRRRDRRAGAVPGPLPLAGRRAVPAARPPPPRQLEPRHLARRRRRRRAARADHLRLHRRHVPGLAAARRGDRRRGARLRVRAAAREASRSRRGSASSRCG